MPADDSALIAAFRAVLAKAREIESDNRHRTVSFRLHELGAVVRVVDVLPRRDPAEDEAPTYVRASEQTAPWRELEHARGGPEMVMRHTLERAVADIEKGAGA